MQIRYNEIYQQALKNPLDVSEGDLLAAIAQWPYSQPLYFALLRRYQLAGKEADAMMKATALLHAGDATWLYNYVHRPLPEEQVEDEVVDIVHQEVERTVELEETEVSRPDDRLDLSAECPAVVETAEDLGKEAIYSAEQDVTIPDISVHSLEKDGFSFEEQPEVQHIERSSSVVGVSAGEQYHRVSVYDDELMPYSFRWWLHKTRLEYADTYQPFAVPVLPKPQKGQFDPAKFDKAILDQQIKENIIHFQDPEMKLSEEVKQKQSAEVPPRKVDDILEKFIREEPIIRPPAPDQLNTENMARKSAEDDAAVVTETLANIYVSQGMYQKAVGVFKKLILKYPEKKSYFATRIEELEKSI